jgi:ribonuclease PH
MTETSTAPAATPARSEGRSPSQLRPVGFTPDFLRNADASVLVEVGGTRVICTASIEDGVPRWLAGTGKGWVTAEYGMLPGSTGQRKRRDKGGKQDGRSVEIQRLIGRSLRAGMALDLLGERAITVDCDVIDADGGTRCASICGGWVALRMLADRLLAAGDLERDPIAATVSAVSVGIVAGVPLLDLDYPEDSTADVDMNLVATTGGEGHDTRLVEAQASAEGATFARAELDTLLDLALAGCAELGSLQRAAAAAAARR